MTTSRFLMSGLNLWLHTGLSDLDVLTVVIILVSSVRLAGGLNLPQLDWLMFSLSFTHSLHKHFCGFTKGKKAHGPVGYALPTVDVLLEMFPIWDFFISFGKCRGTWFMDSPFCPLISTQVHVRFLRWLRATNVFDWGQTFKH